MKIPAFLKSLQVIRTMGSRYLGYRIYHELLKRSGLQKFQYPQNPPPQSFISLEDWRVRPEQFLFDGHIRLSLDAVSSQKLKKEFAKLLDGSFTFFSSLQYRLGNTYDWITNPETNYKYNACCHWTQIDDFDKEAGDIKYVWEKSRFSHVYTILRFDAQTGEDHSILIWDEILSWILANPINSGPNYKCSQEISLRILNWTFALYYYKNSASLTEDIFQKIIFSIYWQLDHVYKNINFSRIAVRNNHAITETLALYLGGLLYPFYPKAEIWKAKGKAWFEKEIEYQIYPDGTFLQFSMNYHRVVVQLLTLGIRLSELNNEHLSEKVYDRAHKSLIFLTSCINPATGFLPNYGANDGALFFKLNSSEFGDYRPQLEALSNVLGVSWCFGSFEDTLWFGSSIKNVQMNKLIHGASSFETSGYYIYRNNDSFTFLRCGNHHDRPSQADNLHIDLWYNNINILHDAGSYKYNTNETDIKYFMGSVSHNTVMLGDHDQMLKGPRFIWYDWSQCESVKTAENDECYQFEGTIKAFLYLSKNIRHTRKVKIYKSNLVWEIEDQILNKPKNLVMRQLWHTSFPQLIRISARDNRSQQLLPTMQNGYISRYYGKKEQCCQIEYATDHDCIKTIININK